MNAKVMLVGLVAVLVLLSTVAVAQNKYVGVRMCSMCHKTEKQGKQFGIWENSKHAKAYATLTSDAANKIAKEKGLKVPAVEAKECLECHTLGKSVDAKLFDKGFDIKQGVQCETCHGPGSAYKSITVMKNKEKAVAAGLHLYADDAAIEAMCKTCHNEKSPTFKKFDFKEMWGKIKHSIPAAG